MEYRIINSAAIARSQMKSESKEIFQDMFGDVLARADKVLEKEAAHRKEEAARKAQYNKAGKPVSVDVVRAAMSRDGIDMG
ncbi:MAG: hypothetical protein K2F99_01360, partial [Muribaculaceae bacterium]|nr:hypothetical protein [Muribaculaceae bacterium]